LPAGETARIIAAQRGPCNARSKSQNSRNSIVFEAMYAVIEQQARSDQRLDRVEDTVRSIASSRRRP
jgi:hypothetical protein